MKAAFTRTLCRGSGLISMKSGFGARGNLAHKPYCSLIRLNDMGRSVVTCAIGVIPPLHSPGAKIKAARLVKARQGFYYRGMSHGGLFLQSPLKYRSGRNRLLSTLVNALNPKSQWPR
jgi:hypothetical protein